MTNKPDIKSFFVCHFFQIGPLGLMTPVGIFLENTNVPKFPYNIPQLGCFGKLLLDGKSKIKVEWELKEKNGDTLKKVETEIFPTNDEEDLFNFIFPGPISFKKAGIYEIIFHIPSSKSKNSHSILEFALKSASNEKPPEIEKIMEAPEFQKAITDFIQNYVKNHLEKPNE